jgi:hypothetical protein
MLGLRKTRAGENNIGKLERGRTTKEAGGAPALQKNNKAGGGAGAPGAER